MRHHDPQALSLMQGTELQRGRMFMFHKTVSSKEEWRSWERELWKLTRVDPPERQLWAVVLALALADTYRGRAKLQKRAMVWLTEPQAEDTAPNYTVVGTFEWVCNELGLCPVTIQRDVLADVQAGRVRVQSLRVVK